MESSQQKLLESFVAYCKANPSLRFWQALYSWSEIPFIYAHTMSLTQVEESRQNDGDGLHYFYEEAQDVFNWTQKNQIKK